MGSSLVFDCHYPIGNQDSRQRISVLSFNRTNRMLLARAEICSRQKDVNCTFIGYSNGYNIVTTTNTHITPAELGPPRKAAEQEL